MPGLKALAYQFQALIRYDVIIHYKKKWHFLTLTHMDEQTEILRKVKMVVYYDRALPCPIPPCIHEIPNFL